VSNLSYHTAGIEVHGIERAPLIWFNLEGSMETVNVVKMVQLGFTGNNPAKPTISFDRTHLFPTFP